MPRRCLGWIAILCVTAVTLCPLAAEAQPSARSQRASFRPGYSARDAAGWTVDVAIERLQELPAPRVTEATTPASRAQAMTTARTVATRRSSPALRAFLDTTSLGAQELRKAAAFASMNGGDGSMALLLAADARAPGDWATQYNIGVSLMLEGFPRSAKVILDALSAPEGVRAPGGLDLRAVLLQGRGNVLIALNRPREAIPLLKEAREREPMLSEAARSLARAHLLLNEEEEAKRVLRTFGRRFATQNEMFDVLGTEVPPIVDGTIEIENAVLVEGMRDANFLRLSLDDRWPLRKGQAAALEVMPRPGAVDNVAPFLMQLGERSDRLKARDAMAQEVFTNTSTRYLSDPGQWAFPELRSRLQADVMLPWETLIGSIFWMCVGEEQDIGMDSKYDVTAAHRAADVQFASLRFEDEELAARTRMVKRRAAAICSPSTDLQFKQFRDEMQRRIASCTSPECSCAEFRRTAGRELAFLSGLYEPYLSAVKSWYAVAHHRSTAVAAYVEPDDRTLRNLVRSQIDMSRASVEASVHERMQVDYTNRITKLCEPEEAEPDSAEGELASWSDDACEFAKDKSLGYKIDVYIAELKTTCYDIEVEGKLRTPIPGLSLVGSISYTFGGNDIDDITIFVGPGVSVPEVGGVSLGGKMGGFVTINGGQIKDAGPTASVDATIAGVNAESKFQGSYKDFTGDSGGSATGISDSFVMVTSPVTP